VHVIRTEHSMACMLDAQAAVHGSNRQSPLELVTPCRAVSGSAALQAYWPHRNLQGILACGFALTSKHAHTHARHVASSFTVK
jgi:hypothetical protein